MIYPKISVIVPCYNHAQFIIEALTSVFNQSFKDYECIIIDDGSTDNTQDIVTNWIDDKKQFKYFHQANSGLSHARNKGISLSSGIYILPLDSDDKISFNYLKVCFNALEANQEIKIAYGESYFFGKNNKKWNLDIYKFNDLLYKNMIYCTGLYRKKDWVRVGGYDENLKEGLEDWEFWIHILKDGGKVVKLSDCIFYYRLKESSMIRDAVINNGYGYKSRLYIFNKHIEMYRKTNFYDMYFENHKMKKNIENPLLFLSSFDLLLLLIKSLIKNMAYFFNKVYKKVKYD